MRWDRLFDDLESQLEAVDREELAAEVSDRTRREVARVGLIDRLRHAVAGSIELAVDGAGSVHGVLQRVGQGWLLLEVASQPELVVAGHAILGVRGLPVAAIEPDSLGVVESRLDFGHVLRAIARDRATVTVTLRDGSTCAGTIDRVGADFIDVAEHGSGEPRREGGVIARRTVPFAAISLVRER